MTMATWKVPATMLNAAESLISMSAGAMMNYARQLLTQDASIDNITLAEGWGPSSDLPLCVLLRNWKPLQAFDWEPLHSHS